jgi:hypothetical protein
MPDDQASELLTALEKVSPIVSPNTLSVRLRTPLPHLEKEQAEELLTSIFNLLAISTNHGWDLHDVAETVAQYPDIELPAEDRPRFTERLYSVLTTPAIFDTASAADVATEYEALYHLARVFTDVRSVPSAEPDSDISTAIITNTLKIEYFTSDDSEVFTLTLSERDLKNLVDTLNDAIIRIAKVRDALKGSRLRVFAFDEDSGAGDASTS